MTPRVGASTRVLAVLGDPISHSLSPDLQNAAIRAAGLDGIYVAIRCARAQVEGVVRGLALGGGGGNVTIPHKGRVAALLDEPEAAVLRTGACNTFWGVDGRILGANTDVDGVRAAVHELLEGASPAGARVLLLGAGGAARAAAVALLDVGVERISLANRSADRAAALVERLDDPRIVVVTATTGVDLIVNATSLGLKAEDPLPVALAPFATASGPAVLDLVYRRAGTTPLVEAARALGLRAADGREMLVRQGAASFQRWWGIPAPLEAMRAAVETSGKPGT